MSSKEFATDAEVIDRYPILGFPPPDGLALALRDTIRECAKCMFNEDVWDCHLKEGHIHYSAFMMEMAVEAANATKFGNPQVVGPLASVTQGPVIVSFGAGTLTDPSDQILLTKQSGALYVMLRDGLGPVPVALDNIGCGPGSDVCC